MTLTVETGAGIADADAYVDVAYMDTFIEEHIGATAKATWDGLNPAEQERRIREGKTYLDGKYHHRWRGYRAHRTQGGDWPRKSVVDDDGYEVLSTVVPDGVKRASAYATFAGIATPLMPDEKTPGAIGRKLIKAGPVTIDKAFGSGQSALPRFSRVDRYLGGLINPPGEVGRA